MCILYVPPIILEMILKTCKWQNNKELEQLGQLIKILTQINHRKDI